MKTHTPSRRTQSRRDGSIRGAQFDLEVLEDRLLLSSFPLDTALHLPAVTQPVTPTVSTKPVTPKVGAPANWGYSAWQYRKTVTIDHTKVPANQSNFSVLVTVVDPNLASYARSDGWDILFTASDGTTKLSHEIESYDPTTGRLVAWVKVPTLSSTADTSLYMYYGNSVAANQQNPTAVWDGNYLSVQHLEESSGIVTDSTANVINGTASGVTRGAAGEIGSGYTFDGSTGEIIMPRVFSTQTSFTVEGWVNASAKQGYIFTERDTNGAMLQYYAASGQFQFYVGGVKVVAAAAAGSWHYVACTFDGSTARLYLDGNLAGSAAATLAWPNLQLIVGNSTAGDRAFSGTMDELRFSNVARSQSFIQANMNNQSSPVSFVAIGAQESSGTSTVTIGNTGPVNGATGVPITLNQLTFSINDPSGGLMNYTVTTSPTIGSATVTGAASGTYSVPISGLTANTKYSWSIHLVAGTTVIDQTYTFTTAPASTAPLLNLKWTLQMDLTNTVEGQLMPVAGDVDHDGKTEIVVTCGDTLYCIDGATGTVKWKIAGDARESAPELVDLNNDGTPEILYGLRGARLRAVNGDGTIRWTTQLQGDDQSLFPILAADIDGSGYPTIYFCTEDQDPAPYDGNMADYNGALTKLDCNGNILKTTWLYHPCWGGASLGYIGGKFIIFVSDRRDGYNNMPSHGLAAYDAVTLATLWTRPDIHHSSPIPILADVNGDGQLELVAQRIVNEGPMIINPLTGATIKDYSNLGLPTHGTATVYDVDEDGHLEIILSTGYPSDSPKNFVVFDLVTGKIDFQASFPYAATWPPRVADINGDGHMEILAAMGDQSDRTDTYPLLVYNYKYQLIGSVNATGAGQLNPAKVYDIDGDGLEEVILTGRGGKMMVYDTPGPVPNPAPRSGIQMYSETRANAAVYVAPQGPAAPKVWQENIVDGSTNVGLGPTLSVRCNDFQLEPMNITFAVAPMGGTFQTIKTYTNVANATYTASTAGYVTQGNTQYQWRVTAVDSKGNTTQRILTFTTGAVAPWGEPSWQYRRQITISKSKVSGTLTNFPVLVDITSSQLASHALSNGNDFLFTASDGVTKLSDEIESYDPATGHLVAWVELPSLSSAADTALYLYYGNAASANQQDKTGTWDSNYVSVQHLEETSGAATDSTVHAVNGTPQNGVTQGAAGKIGNGYSFDGVDDRVAMPQVFTNQTSFTIEGWFNPGTTQGYIVNQRDSSGNGVLLQYYGGSSQFQFLVNGAKVSVAASPNTWHYVVATYSGGTAKLYVDGVAAAPASGSLTWPALGMYLGDNSSGGRAYSGLMDEVRFSAVDRGQNYAITSYNNQSNSGAFALVSSEQSKA